MKKIFLALAFMGALAPYALYLAFLPFPQWKNIFLMPIMQMPALSGEALALSLATVGVQAITIAVALLWAAWNNPKLSRTHKWMLTALTFTLSPACSLPLYFYFTWNE